MSMIDYGALLRINGKLVNRDEQFMNMKNSIGVALESSSNSKGDLFKINGNYFVYAGDKSFFLCFYKTHMLAVENGVVTLQHWNKFQMEKLFLKNGVTVTVSFLDNSLSRKNRNNRFIAEWTYNNNHYEVVYGYGIDTGKEMWDSIKNTDYNFTGREIEIIDNIFSTNY